MLKNLESKEDRLIERRAESLRKVSEMVESSKQFAEKNPATGEDLVEMINKASNEKEINDLRMLVVVERSPEVLDLWQKKFRKIRSSR